MNRLIPALALLLLVPCATQAIKVSAFTDIDTFLDRSQDMVIAKCLGPVPDASRYDDGLYPVDVQVLQALKGPGPKNKSMKPGKAKIATIYAMEAGKTYLLTSMGGLALWLGYKGSNRGWAR